MTNKEVILKFYEEVFNNPTLFHGVITWNNGEIDISPELVYRDSYAYDSP